MPLELKVAVARAAESTEVKALEKQGGFLCSVYIIVGPKEQIESWNLNYYFPKTGKITPVAVTADTLEFGEPDKPVHEKTFSPFATFPEVDENAALEKAWAKARELKVSPMKIILSLQKNDLEYWSVTFLSAGGNALNVRIEANTGELLIAEMSNLMKRD